MAFGDMALEVTDTRYFVAIATIPMRLRPATWERIEGYEFTVTDHPADRATTVNFRNRHTGNILHTFHLAFGALMPALFGHFLFFAEPMQGTIRIVDFRGYL
jgi:hypothetical protein